MKDTDKIINWATELQSLSQTALFYCKDKFDKERFQRIREIAAEMIALKTGLSLDKVKDLFCGDEGYQTPKIDTRAAIFKDDKVLLVRESDGRWTLPGGWCEFNLTPAENVVKEVKEEAGLDVTVDKLVAVHDRERRNADTYTFGVAKFFFLCSELGGEFTANIETIESKYFAEDELPVSMANEKCTAAQIKLCFKAYRADFWETQFD
ncbi:MAG: NUDIX hydrolase [Selenomonadaceae bacterium]|nr:NUDIX hydrolase [Selenomonadaceae bacterium]